MGAGFWKGNTLTVLKTIPQSAIQFAAYDGAKDALLSIFPRSGKDGLSQVPPTQHAKADLPSKITTRLESGAFDLARIAFMYPGRFP